MAIRNFANAEVEKFFITGKAPRKAAWVGVARIARRKLDMIDYATEVGDLRAPPNNRLEQLRGALKGMWSIRVNDQFRVIFRWPGF